MEVHDQTSTCCEQAARCLRIRLCKIACSAVAQIEVLGVMRSRKDRVYVRLEARSGGDRQMRCSYLCITTVTTVTTTFWCSSTTVEHVGHCDILDAIRIFYFKVIFLRGAL